MPDVDIAKGMPHGDSYSTDRWLPIAFYTEKQAQENGWAEDIEATP